MTDGTHTAHVTLLGDYTGSTFTAKSDGHGGTIVGDQGTSSVSAHPLIAAMASLGASGTGLEFAADFHRHLLPTMLGAPRTQIA
ncbi:MAG: hypothetical protein ABI906_03400 [Pseudomonadota bacterium]